MMAKHGQSPIAITFEEFNNKFFFVIEAMSNVKIENIGRDICLKPIVMRDQTPETIIETRFKNITNLYLTGGTQWVLVIGRVGYVVFYFDSLGVETAPFFLEV